MTHELKLQPKYFEFIKNGTKRIELRLNDEKRRLIKINDTIKFYKEPELIEYIEVKVIELLNYENFNDLINKFDISIIADSSMTKTELLNDLEKFYTSQKQKEYGVLGIRIEL